MASTIAIGSSNLRGAFFMVLAMSAFTINDTLVKLVLEELQLGQILLLRGIIATALIALLAWRLGELRNITAPFHPIVFLRALAELGATITFLIALKHMPIANTAAILAALPLAVTMAGAVLLGEQVGWRRWSAILIGFVGILVIVRPGLEGFNVYALLALGTVAFAVCRDLLARKAPTGIPSLYFALTTSLAITAYGVAASATVVEWRPISTEIWIYLVFAGALISIAYQSIVLAMQNGDIASVTPFRYSALLLAVILGYFVFGDVPDLATAIGSVMIVATGIYTFYREQGLVRSNA